MGFAIRMFLNFSTDSSFSAHYLEWMRLKQNSTSSFSFYRDLAESSSRPLAPLGVPTASDPFRQNGRSSSVVAQCGQSSYHDRDPEEVD
jgi:hypothetical protein